LALPNLPLNRLRWREGQAAASRQHAAENPVLGRIDQCLLGHVLRLRLVEHALTVAVAMDERQLAVLLGHLLASRCGFARLDAPGAVFRSNSEIPAGIHLDHKRFPGEPEPSAERRAVPRLGFDPDRAAGQVQLLPEAFG